MYLWITILCEQCNNWDNIHRPYLRRFLYLRRNSLEIWWEYTEEKWSQEGHCVKTKRTTRKTLSALILQYNLLISYLILMFVIKKINTYKQPKFRKQRGGKIRLLPARWLESSAIYFIYLFTGSWVLFASTH